MNRKYVGFGVDFFDFDHDGWADLFMANGHVYSQLATRALHLTYRQPQTPLSQSRQRTLLRRVHYFRCGHW